MSSEMPKYPEEIHTLSPEAAKEWMLLQASICEKLTTENITEANQLDPEILDATAVHLATCQVENHSPIRGLTTEE